MIPSGRNENVEGANYPALLNSTEGSAGSIGAAESARQMTAAATFEPSHPSKRNLRM